MSVQIAAPRYFSLPRSGSVVETHWHPFIKSTVFVLAVSAPWAALAALIRNWA